MEICEDLYDSRPERLNPIIKAPSVYERFLPFEAIQKGTGLTGDTIKIV